MPPEVLAFLLNCAVHSSDLAQQGAKLWADTAHGEGGFNKWQKAAADLGAIFGTLSGVAAGVQQPAAPVTQQQPQ